MNTYKKPLYKVLYEEMGDQNLSVGIKALDQYRELATENLHHLAEALEELHKAAMDVGVTEWWQKHKETVAKAKEALNKIS